MLDPTRLYETLDGSSRPSKAPCILGNVGIHPGCIRWCSMHACNLGINFATNGASLKLGYVNKFSRSNKFGPGQRNELARRFEIPGRTPSRETKIRSAQGLRMLLCELMHFGPLPFEDQLETAYQNFVSFCQQRKIPHSQPCFLPRHAAWLKS